MNYRHQWVLMVLFSVSMSMAWQCPGQSNIVYNGSFEILSGPQPAAGWTTSGGWVGYVYEYGGADGRNFVRLSGGTFTQLFPAVATRTYQVRFAFKGGPLSVKWDGALIGQVSAAGGDFAPWIYTNLYVMALNDMAELAFAGSGYLDDVSVGWAEEPPSIATAVPSRSSFEDGTVTFPVTVSGVGPLYYQWLYEDEPLPGATNQVLVLTNVQRHIQGDYQVSVSNAFGLAHSLPATLVVRAIPKEPLIVTQPRDVQMTAGYTAGFFVYAVGMEPLFYQWQVGGTNLTGATNSILTLPAVSTANAGEYRVVVSNVVGTALSLPASLTVQLGVGGGAVDWNNFSLDVNAPVFDVDGITPLEGPDHVAQLYAGAQSNQLHAVGSPVPFKTGSSAGYYYGSAKNIPDVLAGQTAYVQVRAWNTVRGDSYEAAATLGGAFGASDIMAVQVTALPDLPAPLTALWSFNLQAGQPLLATAKLYPGTPKPGGNREWWLVGDIGARYVVERRNPPNDWVPILVVTNTTGTVTFTDTNAANAAVSFYRAQIIDE